MVAALVLTLYTAILEKRFLEANQIVSPDISIGPILLYFFGVVAVMALFLFIVPVAKLRLVFRVLFTLMFAWGALIILGLVWPSPAVYAVAIAAGVAWLLWARVWFHDLLLLITLCAAGSVFGFVFSPLTFMIFMLVVAVYDILAVRFGFMIWMADKLSESSTLPAFVFPGQMRDWKADLRKVRVADLREKEPGERQYTILGGGDIGFPLMLTVSVFFESGLGGAVIVGILALAGLMTAFLIQMLWLKGKPMPALPSIAFLSLVGFLLVSLFRV